MQSGNLALLLIFVYIYMNNKEKFKSYKIDNFILSTIIGIFLGLIANIFRYWGGPINVAF